MKETFNKLFINSKNNNLTLRESSYIYAYKKIESIIKKKQIFE